MVVTQEECLQCVMSFNVTYWHCPDVLLKHITMVCGPPREGNGVLKAVLVEAGGSEKLLTGGAKLSGAAGDPEVSAPVCDALTPSYQRMFLLKS